MSLRPDQLDVVRRLVTERSAIQLEAGKEYLIEARLDTLARLEGVGDASAIVEALRRSPSGPMAQKVVEAMTTNETSFFRDRLPFDALRDTVLPALIASRAGERRLNIWCAASSTGQEPYSIAMTIREHFPELATWKVQLIATDISTEVLDKARSGRYSQLEVNRGLPAQMLVRYFDKDGARWRVKDSVREMVEYREMNLVAPWPPMPRLDIVFIRNVMIYFDVPSRQRILSRISGAMARDGYLFMGAGETTLNVDASFARLDLDKAGCFQLVHARPQSSPLTAASEARHALPRLAHRQPASPAARP